MIDFAYARDLSMLYAFSTVGLADMVLRVTLMALRNLKPPTLLSKYVIGKSSACWKRLTINLSFSMNEQDRQFQALLIRSCFGSESPANLSDTAGHYYSP
jgi:hypothetical protein